MILEVSLIIKLDPEANFIEVDLSEMERVLEELISAALYDIDDVIIEECEVHRND